MAFSKFKAYINYFWSFLERGSYQLVYFLVTVAFARIYTPKEFGLLAILMSIIALCSVFIDGGMGTRIIQKKTISNKELSSIFWLNIFVGVSLYFILFLFSGLIGELYGEPILVELIRLSSISVIFNALSIVQYSLLIKKLKFKLIFYSSSVSLYISGAVSVALAVFTKSIYCIVAFFLINSILQCVVYWLISKWYPKIYFNTRLIKENWESSKYILGSSIIESLYQSSLNFSIGKIVSLTQLGVFSQAKKLQETPFNVLSTVVRRVTVPSQIQASEDENMLSNNYLALLKKSSTIFLLIAAALFISAEVLISFIFGEKWIQAVPYFRVLIWGGVANSLFFQVLDVYKIRDKNAMYFKLNAISKLVLFCLFIVTVNFDLMLASFVISITSVISLLFALRYIAKELKTKYKNFLLPILNNFAIVLFLILLEEGFKLYFRDALSSNYLIVTISGLFTFFISYVLINSLLYKSKALSVVKRFIN